MVEIVYHVAVSLDGYIATPDGGVDWLPVPELDGQDYGFNQFYASIDGLLMGRGTYEKTLEFDWPYAGKPCWVFSRQPIAAQQDGVVHTTSSPQAIMQELEALGHQRVWLVGGGELATSFRGHGLIAEYVLALIPRILGTGIPLLKPTLPQEQLTLMEHQVFPDGVALLRYRSRPH